MIFLLYFFPIIAHTQFFILEIHIFVSSALIGFSHDHASLVVPFFTKSILSVDFAQEVAVVHQKAEQNPHNDAQGRP